MPIDRINTNAVDVTFNSKVIKAEMFYIANMDIYASTAKFSTAALREWQTAKVTPEPSARNQLSTAT